MADNVDRPPVPGDIESDRQETLVRAVPEIDSQASDSQGSDAGTVADAGVDAVQAAQDAAGSTAASAPVAGVTPVADAVAEKGGKPKRGHGCLKTAVAGLAGGVVGAAAITAGLWYCGVVQLPGTHTTDTTNQQITINATDTDATVSQAVAKKALPSVVSISVTTDEGSGVGSGVILDKDGNILTNYPVIDGAKTISVTIDGKSYDGTVLGSDSSSDLAVVNVDLGDTEVTPIEVGDSSQLVVGDWVMAIGSPYGLDQSVSTGIVSSLYRSTMLTSYSGSTIYANLIQTDAAINPGNSGGALVDDEGKLIGINSIIESNSGSSSGVGFAIDGNYAVKIAKTIISGEKVTHAYLGASLATVNAENAQRAQLAVSQGAYVRSVESDSPADKAGLKEGDVITKVDDQDIMSADALKLAIRAHDVGDKVTITVMRGSSEKTLEVTLGSDEKLQEQEAAQQQEAQQQSQQGGNRSQGNGQGEDGSGSYGLGDLGSLLGGN